MRFLIDHNVPIDVPNLLRGLGHDVVLVGDIMAPDSPDQVVATAAMENDRILVSHDRDMRRIERAISDAFRERFPNLSRLQMCCPEVTSAERLQGFMAAIQAEHDYLRDRGEPMLMDLGERRMRFIR